MDISVSLSNTVSKNEVLDNIDLSSAYFDDLKGRGSSAISNEQIKKGDLILDTYIVSSDAVCGGMGSVWRVHHSSWDTDLAMKRPLPAFFAEAGDEKKKRFVEECEHWINLGLHPNIVSCYYVREIGGVPTIFSEWMDNGSLKERIRDGSLYEGEEKDIQTRILDVAIQSARGLRYSHEQGLIHQDMKPGNLLLTKEWDAKIADFGLAAAQSHLNQTKVTGYTIAYCPKEQAEGDEPRKWMDVYAWAVTVLEMYAGKRLWDSGDEAEENIDAYFPQCRIPVPDEIQNLLKECLTAKTDNLKQIEETLLSFYSTASETKYARLYARAADTADVLNNRALSYIDLGKTEEAFDIFAEAQSAFSNHPDIYFNMLMDGWIEGVATDIDILSKIRSSDDTGKKTELLQAVNKVRGFDQDFFSLPKEVCDDPVNGSYRELPLFSRYISHPCGDYMYSKYDGNAGSPKELYKVMPDGTLHHLDTLTKEDTAFDSLSLSADGEFLVLYTAGYRPHNISRIMLYHIPARQIIDRYEFTDKSRITRSCLCAGYDGSTCYIGREDGVCEFDFATHQETLRFPGETNIENVILRNHGNTLLFNDGHHICTAYINDPDSRIVIDIDDLCSESAAKEMWFDLSGDGKTLQICSAEADNSFYACFDLLSGEQITDFLSPSALREKMCDISGNILVTRNRDGISFFDIENEICLRSIQAHRVEAAKITEVNEDQIEGFFITSSPGYYCRFSIPAAKPRPVWSLSRIKTTGSQLEEERAFFEAVYNAENAVKKNDWNNAAAFYQQAREFSQRKNTPECRRLYDLIFPHAETGRLLECRFAESIRRNDLDDQMLLIKVKQLEKKDTKTDPVLRAAKKRGLGYFYQRTDTKDGITVLQYDRQQLFHKKTNGSTLDFYNKEGELLKSIKVFDESPYRFITLLPGGLMEAQNEYRIMLYNVSDILEKENPDGFELFTTKELHFNQMDVYMSADRKRLFILGRMFELLWELIPA